VSKAYTVYVFLRAARTHKDEVKDESALMAALFMKESLGAKGEDWDWLSVYHHTKDKDILLVTIWNEPKYLKSGIVVD
jgi:hypothetical protein